MEVLDLQPFSFTKKSGLAFWDVNVFLDVVGLMWDSLPDPEWHENHCRINSSPISTMCQKSTPQHFVCRRIDAIPESWAPFSSQGGVQTLITHAPLDKTVKKLQPQFT